MTLISQLQKKLTRNAQSLTPKDTRPSYESSCSDDWAVDGVHDLAHSTKSDRIPDQNFMDAAGDGDESVSLDMNGAIMKHRPHSQALLRKHKLHSKDRPLVSDGKTTVGTVRRVLSEYNFQTQVNFTQKCC